MKPFLYSDYSPSSLPEVTEVEIVLLEGKFVNPADLPPKLSVRDAPAQLIANFFRQLPPGESARCHLPSLGLIFKSGTTRIGSASLCWKCTNLYFYSDGKQELYGFDKSAPAAKQLLAELCILVDIKKTENVT